MKLLLLIRHAKSDQTFFGDDFERPLNERGKKDAPVMANRLLDRQIKIDAFVSSPAKRAKKTAELFAKQYGSSEDAIIFIPSLYHAGPPVFSEVIAQLPDKINNAAVFSHNPGITYFVNGLIEKIHLDNMPTCGIFALQADIDSWSDFANAKKVFIFFDYPKNK
ncbi:MAG: histidine phosphatase family protein [Ferruginibacter sp.]